MKDISYDAHMAEWLHDPAHGAQYLNAALEDDDCLALVLALERVVKARSLQSADMCAKLQRTFRLAEERGLTALAMSLARPVDGRIWEFRVTGRNGIARSLYAAASGRTFLVLRTFVKKAQKTPRAKIEMAKHRLAEDEHAQDYVPRPAR